MNVKYPDSHIILLGDLYARTGNESDYIIDDSVHGIPNMDWYTTSNFNELRQSKDT